MPCRVGHSQMKSLMNMFAPGPHYYQSLIAPMLFTGPPKKVGEKKKENLNGKSPLLLSFHFQRNPALYSKF